MGSLAKGTDARYYTASVSAERRSIGDYYTQATGPGGQVIEAEGEPPGRWWGAGAKRLGLEGEVENGPYEQVYYRRVGPNGEKLGRDPSPGAARATARYEELLAAEPDADLGRRRELRIEAQRETRQSPNYFDLTVSASKSLSLFTASLGENARLCAERGDAGGVAYWTALVEECEEAWNRACDAGLEYFSREAGWIRTGDHAQRADGTRVGQWRKAETPVATFSQHTSREGDPQNHRHQVMAHAAYCPETGKWGAPDSAGYHGHVRPTAAITSVYFETWLTSRFGLEWTPRKDGYGFEIAGMDERTLKALSSRRTAIDKRVQEKLLPEFVEEYGRQPNQRELASMYQGANLSLRHGKDGLIDWDATRKLWAERTMERAGTRLEDLAPRAWGYGEPRVTREPGPDAPTRERVARMAVERVQNARPSWSRADLLAAVGHMMPRVAMDPVDAVRGIESLTDEILAGRFGEVVSLEAPMPVDVPLEFQREDGKSVFERPGSARYATRAQLAREEEIVDLSRGRAPALERAEAARLLGAEVEELEDALHGRVADAMARTTSTGYRLDQAAIVYHMVISGNQVDVVNAAAGSGKTTLATIAARIWEQAGGDVVGIAPSQSATQTLSAGIARSFNTAQFLGHLPEERGARGAIAIDNGTLAVADEGSMISTSDLVDLLRYVAMRGGKVSLLGDVHQLQAVESGGGMSMLARILGYASLAQPVRMAEQWERDASGRLRNGDLSALGEYDEHGRIRGGTSEVMLEAAAKSYVAMAAQGTDALLVVGTHELRDELSRRIQGYLADRGVVSTDRMVRLGGNQRAGAGDLIVCTANDNKVSTGDGNTLNNHGLFHVDAVNGRTMTLRRVLDAGKDGSRTLAGESFTYSDPARFELGYAVTQHAAQSRTVSTGIAVISGSETLEGAYVALSRGRDSNLAYVFTQPPKKADPAPGFKPAEEIARHELLARERAGEEVPAELASEEALAVLADVFSRSGEELAATEYQSRQLAQADNLADLGSVWFAVTGRIRDVRYAEVAREASTGQIQDSHTARWLHRSMRNAELAGVDPARVVREVVDSSPLTGSRDTAAVIDYRVRKATQGLVPEDVRPWSEQVPEVDNPAMQRFIRDVAQAMDERQTRIGEHAARNPEHWVEALGRVPDEPVARLDWERRAGVVGAYREIYGFNHPTEAIGSEPGLISPDKRSLWFAANLALDGKTGDEVGSLDDGAQELRMRQFEAETAWAPRDVSLVLGAVRRDLGDARIDAANRDAEAQAARGRGELDLAQRHVNLARNARVKEGAYTAHESLLAGLAEDRAQWDAATGPQRKMAVASWREMARRYPDRKLEPIRSAEREPVLDTEQALDVAALKAEREAFAERLAERESMRMPEEDHELGDVGYAFRAYDERDHGPILVPPKPQIEPSERVLARRAEQETRGNDRELG